MQLLSKVVAESASKTPLSIERIVNNNKLWAQESLKKDPEFFSSLVGLQKPEYLWIGCADSRVPANEIVGLKPGELFVHRNVANQAPPSDINLLAVVQYSVQVLKVKDIIVTGHYGCGGIKAAFQKHDHGPLQAWLSYIREVRGRHKCQLIHSQQENQNLLTELNVKAQVANLARIPVIQRAWKDDQQLRIHGFVYNLADGLLKNLNCSVSSLQQVAQQYVMV